MSNIMLRGAGRIAAAVFGEDTDATRRIIYRWSSETSGPFMIHRDGRVIYCWESDLATAQGGPAVDEPPKGDPVAHPGRQAEQPRQQ
jgi:hypothetical protein